MVFQVEICWNNEMKALILLTVLEGKPFGIWLEAMEEEQGIYI